MKRWVVLVFFLLVCAPASAEEKVWSEDPKWHGPGWYATSSSFFAVVIDSGPYDSEAACEETLPSEEVQNAAFDEMGFIYMCKNL